jgi:flagellar biosynthesis chaperone FliJ
MSYTSNLETLLYYAHQKIDKLTQEYELNINDKQYTINQLQQLEQILTQYKQPINIKIRKLGENQ